MGNMCCENKSIDTNEVYATPPIFSNDQDVKEFLSSGGIDESIIK